MTGVTDAQREVAQGLLITCRPEVLAVKVVVLHDQVAEQRLALRTLREQIDVARLAALDRALAATTASDTERAASEARGLLQALRMVDAAISAARDSE